MSFQISDLRHVGSGIQVTPRSKTINIGWKHRYFENETYQQQKRSKGGIKKITIQSDKIYSVKDIIELAVLEFKSEFAKDRISKSNIKLGTFNDVMFVKFCNSKDEEIGIVDYFEFHSIKLNNQNLYIFTTTRFDQLPEMLKYGNDSNGNESNDEDSEQDKENDLSISPGKGNSNSPVLRSTVPRLKEDISQQIKEKENLVRKMISAEFEKKDERQQEDQQVIDLFKNSIYCYNTAEAIYAVTSMSQYSGAFLCAQYDEEGILYCVLRNDQDSRDNAPDSTSHFDAADWGYQICTVIINGSHFLNSTVDNDGTFQYSFPSAKMNKPHSIIHDVDEVMGF